MKKTKWLIYTLLVGLIPFFARIIVIIILEHKNWQNMLAPVDFIILGLVLCVSNINELAGHDNKDERLNFIGTGISVLLIFVFGVLFASDVVSTNITNSVDSNALFVLSLFLSLITVLFSYAIFDRLNKSTGGK